LLYLAAEVGDSTVALIQRTFQFLEACLVRSASLPAPVNDLD
jgi:hypothetical protein